MKTNSNSYTIIYSAILVLIVAFLLAFVFQALKPMQDANVQLDQQKQILFALNQDRNMSNEEAVELWKKIIVADDIIDANGKVVEAGKQGGVDAGFKLNSKDAKEGKLALFRCKVNGEDKYVIPVYGNGLWGPINGFIAINGDKRTVFEPTSITRARLLVWVPKSRTTRHGRICSRVSTSSLATTQRRLPFL